MKRSHGDRRRLMVANTLGLVLLVVPLVYAATEAPAGFDNLTNGFLSQAQFDLDKEIFDEAEEIDEGLGPIYNAQACRECHQNPVSGGISQITELRVARFNNGVYSEPPGGNLINHRAIHPDIQERVSGSDNVSTRRTSLTILGDGFVEAIANSTITGIQASQPTGMKGTIINVPVLERPGQTRIGRFGWKNQHASLVSFSADAYLNEQGITSPLAPQENTSARPLGRGLRRGARPRGGTNARGADRARHRGVRPLHASPRCRRDAALATSDAKAGGGAVQLDRLQHLSPGVDHDRASRDADQRRRLRRSAGARGQDHPSLQRLHAPRRGDGRRHHPERRLGNAQQAEDRRALWGLRTRTELMHDGATLTRNNAILRHTNEAERVIQKLHRAQPHAEEPARHVPQLALGT